MAPLGRLLAYYVRENGEGVADNLQFAVKPFFENQVSKYRMASRAPGLFGKGSRVMVVLPFLLFLLLFNVQCQVSVAFSANETRPGDSVSVTVRAAKGSCVCLAAVDKSIYLFKPGFQLTADQVSSIPLGVGNALVLTKLLSPRGK